MVKLPFKLLILTTTPVVIALLVTFFFITYESNRLSEQTLVTLEKFLMESKKQELLNYSKLADSAIEHIYGPSNSNGDVAKQLVSDILEEMSFGGDDGYFFVYDDKGNSIAHPKQPFRVGKNWWDLEDESGAKIIQVLISNAKNGGDFYQYDWNKPSANKTSEKISYSWYLDKWGWMVGTGIYLDDIQFQLSSVQNDIGNHIKITEQIILGIAISTILTIFSIGLFLALKEKTRTTSQINLMSQRIVNSQEEERRKISREMHDGIVQMLVAIKYSLEAVHMSLVKQKTTIPEPLDQASINLNTAIQEIRRISHDLHPRVLDELGLGQALDSLTNEFSERTEIEVDLTRPAVKKVLPDDLATTLYRVVQESLTNIERHSQAKSTKIDLYFTPKQLVLEISDDGCGFNVDQLSTNSSNSIGLRNLTERIEYEGGKLEVASGPKGTTITAKIPRSEFQMHVANNIEVTIASSYEDTHAVSHKNPDSVSLSEN